MAAIFLASPRTSKRYDPRVKEPNDQASSLGALEYVRCNLCGSMDYKLRFKKKGNLTDNLFHIVECEKCGLVFVNPRLSQVAINALYDESYFRGDGFDASVNYQHELEESAMPLPAIDRIRAIKPPPARLLEIGPGMGRLLKQAKAEGYQVVGMDVSGYAVEMLNKQGFEVCQGQLPAREIPDQAYDVVVAIEVVEHLMDPKSFFADVRRILRPGGLFYYETGDIDCEESRRLKSNWDYIMPEGHLYYFSPATMTRYLQEAGFVVCYPYWFNPTRRVVSLLRKLMLIRENEYVFMGLRGKVAREILSIWDRLNSCQPYMAAICPAIDKSI